MSRTGNLPIPLPSGVSAEITDTVVHVSGPKGKLTQFLVDRVTVSAADSQLVVSRQDDARESRANHGLMRSLLKNMVIGVSEGFKKELQVFGVGYRADVRGKELVLNLGYSHPVTYPIPDGISIAATKEGMITVEGIDKQRVGQVAAEIRSYRRPDAYKGKGVRYVGERISLKAGKSAK